MLAGALDLCLDTPLDRELIAARGHAQALATALVCEAQMSFSD